MTTSPNQTDPLPCADKMVFGSKQEAEHTALAADWQHGTALKAYRCKHCTLWHLASDFKE